MNVVILDTRECPVDPVKLTAACRRMKIEPYFSDFSFCPYLYACRDSAGDIDVGNMNSGAVDSHRANPALYMTDIADLETFVRKIFAMKFGSPEEPETNSLF